MATVALSKAFVIVLLYLSTFSNAENETKIIYTDCGLVKGRLEYTLWGNQSYYAFRGIPYAEPPLGDLRFKV